jgi:hypothetical protein
LRAIGEKENQKRQGREEKKRKRTLSSLEDEGNTLPPGRVDVDGSGGEGRADRVLGDGLVVEVTGLVARRDVLTEENVFGLDGRNVAENLDLGGGRRVSERTSGKEGGKTHLLVTDVLRGERNGALHGEDREDLKQVCERRSWT